MNGRIVNLYLKTEHRKPVEPVASAQAESGLGLVGDVSFGRSKRQVLLIEKETLDEFGLEPGRIKENVTVEGMTLAGLARGSLLQVGQAVIEVTGDCTPCRTLEDIRPGLQNEMRGRRGILGRVIEGGTILVGDSVAVVE